MFKTLTDQRVTVELKNDLSITGTLKSVDQCVRPRAPSPPMLTRPPRFLNIRLDGITVLDEARHPHMMAVKNCFIRGSVVRYVQLPADQVDTNLLEDATRRGASPRARTCAAADRSPQRPTRRASGDTRPRPPAAESAWRAGQAPSLSAILVATAPIMRVRTCFTYIAHNTSDPIVIH